MERLSSSQQTCGVTSSLQLQSNVSQVVLPVADKLISNLLYGRTAVAREGEHRCAAQTIHSEAEAALDLVCACMTRRP